MRLYVLLSFVSSPGLSLKGMPVEEATKCGVRHGDCAEPEETADLLKLVRPGQVLVPEHANVRILGPDPRPLRSKEAVVGHLLDKKAQSICLGSLLELGAAAFDSRIQGWECFIEK